MIDLFATFFALVLPTLAMFWPIRSDRTWFIVLRLVIAVLLFWAVMAGAQLPSE